MSKQTHTSKQELVLSDVHVSTCPPGQRLWQTRFTIRAPTTASSSSSSGSSVDCEGDLELPRPWQQEQLTITHTLASPIDTCGTQVWRGACLLSDFLLNRPAAVRGKHTLELGAGVGLVSSIAARAGADVFLTDSCTEALGLAAANATTLSAASKQQDDVTKAANPGRVTCRRLDWASFLHTTGASLTPEELLQLLNCQLTAAQQPAAAEASQAVGPATSAAQPVQGTAAPAPPGQPCISSNGSTAAPTAAAAPSVAPCSHSAAETAAPAAAAAQLWCWSAQDLQQLAQVEVLLAADVIYDPVLTEAFMHAACALMSWIRAQQAPARVTGACQHNTAEPHQQVPPQQQQQPQRRQPQQQQQLRPQDGPPPSPWQQQKEQKQEGVGHQQGVRQGPVLYVAAEKRYNFTLRDLDAVAAAFDHFLSYVHPVGAACPAGTHEEKATAETAGTLPLFMGERITIGELPQLLAPYDRCPELELWRLWLPG